LRDTVSALERNPATEHTAVGVELTKGQQGFTEKVVATYQVPILDLENGKYNTQKEEKNGS